MFVVIEGIDGAGCETQAKLITHQLSKLSKLTNKVTFVKYPDYGRNVGRFIREFLYQNKNLTAEQQFMLYCLQFVFDSKMISEKRKTGVIVADRYFTTTLCYQTLEGINLDIALNFARDFKIEKPDIVFYLNVHPDVAIERKSGEQKEKNRREKDFEFIRRTYKQYEMLVAKQVWTKWVNIDGEKAVDEVAKDIYNKIIADYL